MAEFLVVQLSNVFGMNEFRLTHQMIEFLGSLNIFLAILAASLFILRRVNKHAFSNKNDLIKKIVKPLSKVHPFIGILLLISAYLHGDLALGTLFRMHTGPLVWFVVLIMMLVALIGKRFKVKNWLKLHRALAVVMGLSVMLHLYVRNMLG